MLTYQDFINAINEKKSYDRSEVWGYDGDYFYGDVYRVIWELCESFRKRGRLFAEEDVRKAILNHPESIYDVVEDVIEILEGEFLTQIFIT